VVKQYNLFFIVCVVIIFTLLHPTVAQDKNEEQPTQKQNVNQEDIIDSAIDLDGKTSYVEIVNSDELNKINRTVTVMAWIKATEFANRYMPIIYKGDKRTPSITNRSFVMHLRQDGAVQFASSPNGKAEKYIFSPYQSISLNKWHHVAGVVDTTKNVIKVYVDGYEVGFRDFGRNRQIYKSILPLRIGGSHEENQNSKSSFVGQIDEVSVWNVALTENQISTYMNQRLTADEKGLVGYWKFNNVVDNTLTDSTQNENDGRLVNTAKVKKYIRPIPPNATPEQLAQIAKVYEKALTNKTASYEIYRTLADVYIKIGRSSDAEATYLQALKANFSQSDHEHALRVLWQLYSNRNAVDEYIALIVELRAALKDIPLIFELLGDAHKKIGKQEDADNYYKEWIEIRVNEVNLAHQPFEYIKLAEKLLQKNMYLDLALELLLKAGEFPSGVDFIYTLTHAFIVNEQFEDAYHIIKGIYDSRSLPFVERDLLEKVVEAGNDVKDRDGYVNMLNKLIDAMSDNPRSHLSTTLALAQFYEENGALEKANALIRKTGFITEESWMTLGPFDNAGGIGFNTQYIKENLPKIDTTEPYDGIYGKVRWQKSIDDTLYGHINLGPNQNWSVAYAFATVTSPDEREVQFRFDSDDQGKLWVNGIEVFSHTKTFTAEIDNYIIPVKLSQGRNSILVKVCEEVGGWGFYLRITNKDGKPYDDLIIGSSDEN